MYTHSEKEKRKPFSFFLYEIVVKRLLPSGFPYRHFCWFGLAEAQEGARNFGTRLRESLVCLFNFVGH
jgi:hypothetical protein